MSTPKYDGNKKIGQDSALTDEYLANMKAASGHANNGYHISNSHPNQFAGNLHDISNMQSHQSNDTNQAFLYNNNQSNGWNDHSGNHHGHENRGQHNNQGWNDFSSNHNQGIEAQRANGADEWNDPASHYVPPKDLHQSFGRLPEQELPGVDDVRNSELHPTYSYQAVADYDQNLSGRESHWNPADSADQPASSWEKEYVGSSYEKGDVPEDGAFHQALHEKNYGGSGDQG
jgi:hypothetical protein